MSSDFVPDVSSPQTHKRRNAGRLCKRMLVLPRQISDMNAASRSPRPDARGGPILPMRRVFTTVYGLDAYEPGTIHHSAIPFGLVVCGRLNADPGILANPALWWSPKRYADVQDQAAPQRGTRSAYPTTLSCDEYDQHPLSPRANDDVSKGAMDQPGEESQKARRRQLLMAR